MKDKLTVKDLGTTISQPTQENDITLWSGNVFDSKEVIKITPDCAYLYGEKIEDMGELHREMVKFFKMKNGE